MGYRTSASALLLSALALAQPPQSSLPEAERTRWFREAKFGMFIHWGVYAEIGRHEWSRHMLQIPQAEYDKYAHRFNPVRFNAGEWADIAASAGAKYVIITSKHHDGFSIFRSKVSDYDMEITPYKGDPFGLLAGAVRSRGMRFGFYHSIMDWHHPDYVPKRTWEVAEPKEGGNLDRYLDFMKEQLRELLTGYSDIAVVWFDGEWEHTNQELRSDEIYDFIRKLQPNALINDRLFNRQPGNRADFGTPEQFVPATGIKDPSGKPVLWESCVTINEDSWGYNKYETRFKTRRDLIRMLIEVVSKGGNLLLNVGPMPDGRIQDDFVSRLKAMGEWLKVNGEAIYGTQASPFARLPFFGRATQKGNVLYLHVFQWPADGKLVVPGLGNQVASARLLGAPAARLSAARSGQDVVVTLPAEAPDETASVVALVLDGPPRVSPFVIRPDANGVVRLGAESCEIETEFEQRAKKENALGHVFLTHWTRPQDVPAWVFTAPAGRYRVEMTYGAAKSSIGVEFTVSAGSSQIAGKVADTKGDWSDWVFKTFPVGEIALPGGQMTLRVKANPAGGTPAMSLERVVLTPVR